MGRCHAGVWRGLLAWAKWAGRINSASTSEIINTVITTTGTVAKISPRNPGRNKSGRNALIALLILASMIATILTCYGLYEWRKRSNRAKTTSILEREGGFKLRDDYEEDEVGEDPNLNLQ